MRIQHSTTLTAQSVDMTAGKLSEWIKDLPPEAKIGARTTSGDRPGESSATTLTARWETEL